MTTRNKFARLNDAIFPMISCLVPSVLPQGRREGHYWVALNPTRADRTPGSFKINMHNGRWADYATGDSGGDLISLAAYLYGMRQGDAADYIAKLAGVAANDN